MKEYQTPQRKVSARSSDYANRRFKDFSEKKSNKITKKSLNAGFKSFSEEDTSETSKDTLDFSPISEILDANANANLTENFLLDETSSVTLLPSDMTPYGKIADEAGISSVKCFGASEFDKFASSVEAEVALDFVRKAQSEKLSSANAPAHQYRKIMDEISEFVLEELYTLPRERDHSAQVLSLVKRMLVLCFFIWIIGVLVVLFFTSDSHCTFRGPSPT